ncbi:MAG: YhbY family RNA-binding protein [Pseudomonadota bacterium]
MSTTPDTKTLRTIAHSLHPLVTVAEKGLSDNVRQEIGRALHDHELIKVRVLVGDRAERQRLINAICEQENATLVQRIGHVAVLYRSNPKPDPKLSNILRHKKPG